jgi:class 3 adenylate cyclase
MKPGSGRVLVVDDIEANRDLLARRLQRQGYAASLAEDGVRALELMRQEPFDLVLLDIMMPKMNGYEVLEHLKADPSLRHIPVIVISAIDDMDSIVKCIELGAEDYLSKPFNKVLLKARIGNCLEKKWLRDQELLHLKQLQAEKERSERLLLSILPEPIAEQLKQDPHTIADSFPNVTVLFADIVDFTKLAAQRSPIEVVSLLNNIFSVFDRLAQQHGVEKIKTIGDAYMVVGGLPTPRHDHAEAIAEMALDMLDEVARFHDETGEPLNMRIGINSGPVVAGVIGTNKFIYDLWGDTVNVASRMESHGIAGSIQVTAETYQLLQDKYWFEERGLIPVKGKGEVTTYILKGRKIATHSVC